MAVVTFKGEKFVFNGDKFHNLELMEMERVSRKIGYPLTSGKWQAELSEYGMNAVTLLVYLLKKRQNPQFQFEDMPEFDTDEIELSADDSISPEPLPLETASVETSGSPLVMRSDN